MDSLARYFWSAVDFARSSRVSDGPALATVLHASSNWTWKGTASNTLLVVCSLSFPNQTSAPPTDDAYLNLTQTPTVVNNGLFVSGTIECNGSSPNGLAAVTVGLAAAGLGLITVGGVMLYKDVIKPYFSNMLG